MSITSAELEEDSSSSDSGAKWLWNTQKYHREALFFKDNKVLQVVIQINVHQDLNKNIKQSNHIKYGGMLLVTSYINLE